MVEILIPTAQKKFCFQVFVLDYLHLRENVKSGVPFLVLRKFCPKLFQQRVISQKKCFKVL